MKLLRIAKKIPGRSRTIRGVRCATWALYVSTACCASAMQAHRTQLSSQHVRASPAVGDKAVTDTRHARSLAMRTPIPVSPASAEAMAANVILTNGSLLVEANNSDLSQILGRIADLSGMTIDGSVKSVRVYGTYGPSNARNVLTDLLTGLGYNFMMVGVTHEGVPRKLELTLRSGYGAAAASAAPTSVVSDHHENTDVTPPEEEQPGPGAILHVPPSGPEDPQERTRQNLQRLQQMHDQQKPQSAPQ
jgi:hypothetical protein